MSEIKQDFDLFLQWLEQYRSDINQLVDISVLYGDEYVDIPGEEKLKEIKFWGDISSTFKINGTEFRIISPCDFCIRMIEGKLDITADIRDNGTDYQDYFESLFTDIDVNKIPKEKLNALVYKLDQTYYKYFDVEEVPKWKDRLLNSLICDDFYDRLKG